MLRRELIGTRKSLRRKIMDENLEANENGHQRGFTSLSVNRWLLVAVVVLIVGAGLAFGYGYRQQLMASHLAAQASVANATINEMQGQLNTLTAKLNEMSAAQQAAAAQKKAPPAQANAAGAKPAAGKRSAAENKRLKELQARIDEQQKQLKDTQDQVAKNRADLEGNLNSTRDELNGSIAKTHEELVALAKRGERSYFEFDLTKSKQFQRVGPLTLALRRTDTKHKNFNLDMVVDDNKLTKKNVNLYEPIWIHTENDSQPVQVVVIRVEKNLVHGYVSAPKYKPSELAVSSTNTATVTPVAAHAQPPDQNPPSPKQPE
jgi:uncharacterized coiled-coil protein SlyX